MLNQAEAEKQEKQVALKQFKTEKQIELDTAMKNISNMKEASSTYISKIKASIPRKKSFFSGAKTYAECDDTTFLRELEESNRSGCAVS